MPADLTPLATALDARPYGLILLDTRAGDDVRQALWEVLGDCESLYWLGPLADKPVVAGKARCWLLECPLEQRVTGYTEISRRDPHAIHAIGPVDAPLFAALVQGSLAGFITVAEVACAVDSDDVSHVMAAAAAFGVDATILSTALAAVIGRDGAVQLR